ncbi:MAG: SagB/ThcOx family dehydrogenase [Deltaproteobacteria bacterium]|nr:SagB/ThcOx family dehydrogenase [Deltaproteobacteria bacterium]
MKQSLKWLFIFFIIAAAGDGWGGIPEDGSIRLFSPIYDGKISVERAIKERRTTRAFRPQPLTMVQLSQLFWSAQGITDEASGFRAAPSGGALYPLDVYAVVGDAAVEGLESGVYYYRPESHSIRLIRKGDRRREIAGASLRQMWMAKAPVMFIVTSEYKRITRKYGKRGIRYAQIEVGHLGQNIFFQSGALGLAAGIVGAFNDSVVAEAIGAPKAHIPLIIMPVGYEK